METFSDDAVEDQILSDTGLRPGFALETFRKADDDVKQTAARIKANPFIPNKEIRGFVYEVETGRLREIPLERARDRHAAGCVVLVQKIVARGTSTSWSTGK